MSEMYSWQKAENVSSGSTDNQAAPKENYGAPLSGSFNLTAIPPFSLDFNTRYPVLGIRVTCAPAWNISSAIRPVVSQSGNPFLSTRQIYTKETSFLTVDRDRRFKWVAPHNSSFYKPELSMVNPSEKRKRITRYSVEENIGEDMDMIYPVRPFSITNIDLEGFDPGKDYPVLAIDIDKYLPEEEDNELDQPENSQSETMAFFLVADDNGEFSWIAEDECKLYPLKMD
jgi:hypothetical protein